MTNKKGYFIHNLPNELPSNHDFCFVRSRIGISPEPNLDTYWHQTRYLQRGLYQFPKPTVDNDVYAHSSHMVEDTWYKTDARWIVLCGLYVDLQWISTWVGQIHKQAPNFSPVVYMTYDRWNAILKGDNAEQVALNILNKADLCMSKYGVEKPILPKFASKIKFWEYEQNRIYWNESGLEVDSEFVYLDEPGTPIEEPMPDPIIPPVYAEPKARHITGTTTVNKWGIFKTTYDVDIWIESEEAEE